MAAFHSSRQRPSNLPVGDIWFDVAKRDFYISIADNRLVPLSGLLAGPAIQGLDGATGPQGPQGVQGPQGPSGPQGPRGERGEITVIGDDELKAAVETLRQELLTHRAKLAHALNDARAVNKTMVRSKNTHAHREQVVNQIERLTM